MIRVADWRMRRVPVLANLYRPPPREILAGAFYSP